MVEGAVFTRAGERHEVAPPLPLRCAQGKEGQDASLQSGDNLLAIQLNQINVTSSDVTLGIRLAELNQAPVVIPRITYTYTGGNLNLSWNTGVLQERAALNSGPAWAPVTGVVGNTKTINNVAGAGAKKFYRLAP